MHADQADLVQLGHGGRHKGTLLFVVWRGKHVHDHVHGVVAEYAHAGFTDDLAAWDIWEISGEQVQDGLRDPVAVDVDAVQHEEFALEDLILFDIGLC